MAPVQTLLRAAKPTLSLRLTGVRDDGFHEIEAEMVCLDLHDRLMVDPDGDSLRIMGSPRDLPTGPSNLVNRALAACRRTAGVELHSGFRLRPGWGGSSDAGAILRRAGFTDLGTAAAIGADVPFCLVGGRALVRGIGELVQPAPFEARTFTLVTPPISCSTPSVYQAWDDLGGPRHQHSNNDLEPAALVAAPALEIYRARLWEATESGPPWLEVARPGSFLAPILGRDVWSYGRSRPNGRQRVGATT